DPAREGLSGTGEDRQARPQRVDRSGVRVVVEGVEHEVGDTVAGEGRRGLELGREYQPGGADAGGLSRGAEVARRGGVVVEQPEHAPVEGLEQAHPDVENV